MILKMLYKNLNHKVWGLWIRLFLWYNIWGSLIYRLIVLIGEIQIQNTSEMAEIEPRRTYAENNM